MVASRYLKVGLLKSSAKDIVMKALLLYLAIEVTHSLMVRITSVQIVASINIKTMTPLLMAHEN